MTRKADQGFQVEVIRHFMGRGQTGPFVWYLLGALETGKLQETGGRWLPPAED